MLEKPDFKEAAELLLKYTEPVGTETVSLTESAGRVLAQEVRASADVPGFDRSPYDGYAFRAEDVRGASAFSPATLSVIEHIAAGEVPGEFISIGTAARIMTGAPIPEGADAVVPYEVTKFTETEVQIFSEAKAGQNIVRRGEDVTKGQLLAESGMCIDPGLAGTLAAQGIFTPSVFRKPVVGIISTGDELIDEGDAPAAGKIYNANRYSLQSACSSLRCESVYLGMVRDSAEEIAALIEQGKRRCDAIVLSGGVSAGDFDLTPDAMKSAGTQIMIRGLSMKPGMAGAYGVIGSEEGAALGKTSSELPRAAIPVMALSGNPAACMTAFWLVSAPVLRKLAGLKDYRNRVIQCALLSDFPKASRGTRILRGKQVNREGRVFLEISTRQGNSVLSTMTGSDLLAVIPAGSGPLKAGAVLTGYII